CLGFLIPRMAVVQPQAGAGRQQQRQPPGRDSRDASMYESARHRPIPHRHAPHLLEARVGLVPEAGIEPACLAARDFKSLVSTDFTTRARCDAALYRMLSPARWPGLDPAPPAWQRTVARLRRLRVPERRHARLPGWRCRW